MQELCGGRPRASGGGLSETAEGQMLISATWGLGSAIAQGEVTPDQMWGGRLAARTPVDGLYLCGAATHPAGSVIALNGRNAAAAVLADQGAALAVA